MSGNKWKELGEQLKMIMQKEVALMRELLANMYQEEIHLTFGEKEEWKVLIQSRSELFETLGNLKKARLTAIKELGQLLPLSKKTSYLEQLLALDVEGYEEIILLQDQFSALIERTQFQNARNSHLKLAKQELGTNSQATYNATLKLHRENHKKKNMVITCEKKKV